MVRARAIGTSARGRDEGLALGVGSKGAPRAQRLVQRLQRRFRDQDAADRNVGGALPVKVRAAGHEKTVLLRESLESGDVRRGVLRMPNFDPVQAAARPRGDQMVAVERARVREDRDAAGIAHDGNGLFEGDRPFGNVGRRVMAQETLELYRKYL